MSINQTHRISLGLALILSPVTILAQDPITPAQPQTAPSSSTSSPGGQLQDSNATPGLTGQEMQDKKFLRDIAQGGLAEVKMGQLASTKSGSEDIKALGAKMVTDHSRMGKGLASVADSMGIRLPKDLSKPDQAEYDKLNNLSGDDFDKEYLTVMLADHRKDLRAFRQESISTNDAALHAEIDSSVPVLREHMSMVVKLAREKGVAVPPAPQRAGTAPPSPPQ